MLKNLLIVLLAITSISMFGCRDKYEEPCGLWTFRELSPERNPFLYLEGTYWVYQEVTTGDLDSVWVSNAYYDTLTYNTGFGSGCDKSWRQEGTHVIDLESSRLGSIHSLYVHDRNIDWADPEDVHYIRGFSYGLNVYFDQRDTIARDINEYYSAPKPTTVFQELLNNLQVGGINFQDVAHFRSEAVDFPFLAGPTAFDWYWKGEGIIRKDVRDEQDNIIESWELIRWNVVR